MSNFVQVYFALVALTLASVGCEEGPQNHRCANIISPSAGLEMSADGRLLVCASEFEAFLWKPAENMTTTYPNPLRERVRQVALAPDGTRLAAVAHDDNRVALWEVGDPANPVLLKGHSSAVQAVVFSDKRDVLVSADSGQILVWDLSTAMPSTRLPLVAHGFTYLAISADGKLLAARTANDLDSEVSVWDLSKRTKAATLVKPPLRFGAMTFSPDGAMLAICSKDGSKDVAERTIELWDTRKWSERTIKLGKGGIYAIAFSPDGKMLAVAGAAVVGNMLNSSPAGLQLIDVASGKVCAQMTGSECALVKFMPSGKQISVTMKSHVHILDVRLLTPP